MKDDDVGRGLGLSGLDSFVMSYIGWATQEIDGFEPPQADIETQEFFLEYGRRYLNNAPEQTRLLLQWVEENPFRVAEYLEQVWPNVTDSKSYTDPFRLKVLRGQIPKLSTVEK